MRKRIDNNKAFLLIAIRDKIDNMIQFTIIRNP